jgi:glycosyltransferase involved in cell wall biosynthesis
VKAKCTCLIPVYNEGSRLIDTFNRLRQVQEIDEFIIVDDGSTDGGVTQFAKEFPSISIIRLNKNRGKSAAVRTGLEKIKSPYTLLFDADIRSVNPDQINQGISKIKESQYIDMLIFRRMGSPWVARIARADIVLSGERIVKTDVLQRVMFTNPQPQLYDMEVALNQYCLDNNKDVVWFPAATTNTYKMMKYGLIKGLAGDLKTMRHAAHFVGWKRYRRQISSFCRIKLS